jgi:hypothetical protein
MKAEPAEKPPKNRRKRKENAKKTHTRPNFCRTFFLDQSDCAENPDHGAIMNAGKLNSKG